MSFGCENGDQDVICKEVEALSVSNKLSRSSSQKWKKKKGREVDGEDGNGGVSVKCLSLYGRVGGCKVGTETGEEDGRRSSSVSEDSRLYRPVRGTEDIGFDCFPYGVREKFWKKNSHKVQGFEESVQNSRLHICLPDDILELCLMRLPLIHLMTARLVCKKWRHLTTSSRFLRLRREGLHQNPWLFLFGAVKDGHCSGEIHALDLFEDHWHRIDSDVLKGRFMYSVGGVWDEIYIVGGCSSLMHFGRVDRSSFKTHKGVLAFNPLTKSWRKVGSMKYARSMPILAASEVGSSFSVSHRQERRFSRPRISNVSDVYEDPHRFFLRRNLRLSQQSEDQTIPAKRTNRFRRQIGDRLSFKGSRRPILIAVGGFGSLDEPLDSGELYDSLTNKWTEISKLPSDFGVVVCGVFCNTVFYVYSESDKLMGYDIERGYWMGIHTSPFPPRVLEYYPKLVCCNNRLFMLSVSWCEGDGRIGYRNKAVRKLWELDLKFLTWSEASVHPDAPMDWNAVFVSEKNFIFGVEMFKIFGQVLDFLTVCNVSDDEMSWSHIARNQMAHQLDASSCSTKSMAVLHL